MNRYRFYREHKYVSHVLSELQSNAAKIDMSCKKQRGTFEEQLDGAIGLLEAHAEYEERCLHPLLSVKKSSVLASVEADHRHLDDNCQALRASFAAIGQAEDEDTLWQRANHFYLMVRKFYAEMLLHLDEEEAVILPELQRLYSDEELQKVEAETYRQMSTHDLFEMISILFPHMNAEDYFAFLYDIKQAVPDTFQELWSKVGTILSKDEFEQLQERLEGRKRS